MEIVVDEDELNRALRTLAIAPRFVQSIEVSFPHGAPRLVARVGLGPVSSEIGVTVEDLEVTPAHRIAMRLRRGLGHVVLRSLIGNLEGPGIAWDEATGRMVIDMPALAPWFRLTG